MQVVFQSGKDEYNVFGGRLGKWQRLIWKHTEGTICVPGAARIWAVVAHRRVSRGWDGVHVTGSRGTRRHSC